MKYIRKRLAIEAFHYTEYNQINIPEWFKLALMCGVAWETMDGEFVLDEEDFIPINSWVIKGVLDEIWHIPDEEFEAYYEQIES